MSDRRTVLLIGGPESGKSNYIFRFWLALRDGKTRDIMPGRPPDEAEYLTVGANAQLGGHFAGHTPENTGALCEIPVKAKGDPAALIVPDRPGEEWARLYIDRRWPSEWEPLIDSGTSCLVFIRANSPLNQQPLDWMSVQRSYGENKANLNREQGSPSIGKQGSSQSGPPTQVVAVEWLQMLKALFRNRVGPRHRPRVGIVVSAWDALSLDDREDGPLGFLRRDFRLLSDFIESNTDRFELSVFGVTLFGGDLDKEAGFHDEFIREGNPRERGFVVSDNLKGTLRCSADLTLPVGWALGVTELP